METKNFNREFWYENQTEREFYVEDLKLKINLYNGSLTLVDITNALKTGLTCERYSLNWLGNDSIIGIRLMESFIWDLRKLFKFVQSLDWKPSKYGIDPIYFSLMADSDITIYKGSEKSVRVYSPFALSELKSLKETPKKWTLRHAIRAIVNKQYEYLRCKGVYTDDYAYDAAYNYQQGALDRLSFVKRLIESPSGWWTGDANNSGIVSVCCHSFDSNEFKFKIT